MFCRKSPEHCRANVPYRLTREVDTDVAETVCCAAFMLRHLFALAILVRAVPYVTKTQARFVTLCSKNFSEGITWLSNA